MRVGLSLRARQSFEASVRRSSIARHRVRHQCMRGELMPSRFQSKLIYRNTVERSSIETQSNYSLHRRQECNKSREKSDDEGYETFYERSEELWESRIDDRGEAGFMWCPVTDRVKYSSVESMAQR
jgi:hypothetical protein